MTQDTKNMHTYQALHQDLLSWCKAVYRKCVIQWNKMMVVCTMYRLFALCTGCLHYVQVVCTMYRLYEYCIAWN